MGLVIWLQKAIFGYETPYGGEPSKRIRKMIRKAPRRKRTLLRRRVRTFLEQSTTTYLTEMWQDYSRGRRMGITPDRSVAEAYALRELEALIDLLGPDALTDPYMLFDNPLTSHKEPSIEIDDTYY